jgi:hypothetical protein
VQIKYLYAGHVYGWGAEQVGFILARCNMLTSPCQLSYYISFLGSARALNLLFILPCGLSFIPLNAKKLTWSSVIITTFKPRPKSTTLKPNSKASKPLTKAHLAREMDFDLRLARFSLLIDFASHVLIALSPFPIHWRRPSHNPALSSKPTQLNDSRLQAMFVLSSSLDSFASGTVPAMQSLALCIAQARALRVADGEGEMAVGAEQGELNVGRLFGALAVLQAVGQTILGVRLSSFSLIAQLLMRNFCW